MKNKIILALLFLSSFQLFSQQKIALDLYQDMKLAFMEDDYGNTPFTLNGVAMITLEFKRDKTGHFFAGQSLEYADLAGGIYRRYAFMLAGYKFLDVFLPNVNVASHLDYGYVNRFGRQYVNVAGSMRLSYKLNDRWELSTLFQYQRRKDIENPILPDPIIRFSLLAGINVHLFTFKTD